MPKGAEQEERRAACQHCACRVQEGLRRARAESEGRGRQKQQEENRNLSQGQRRADAVIAKLALAPVTVRLCERRRQATERWMLQ